LKHPRHQLRFVVVAVGELELEQALEQVLELGLELEQVVEEVEQLQVLALALPLSSNQ
jgi:hypothetical protein